MTHGYELGDLDGVRVAHARVVQRLQMGFDPRAASSLPDWTIGHVATDIARNADSATRMFASARRGEVADQYEGGFASRAADIDAGASRLADALVSDVQASGDRLIAVAEVVDAELWESGRGRVVSGDEFPLWCLLVARWREVEIHHCDLGLGYSPRDWSDAFVDRALSIRLTKSTPDASAEVDSVWPSAMAARSATGQRCWTSSDATRSRTSSVGKSSRASRRSRSDDVRSDVGRRLGVEVGQRAAHDHNRLERGVGFADRGAMQDKIGRGLDPHDVGGDVDEVEVSTRQGGER